MAYAALASLAQTINLILNPFQYSISADAKHKIMCIHDYVIFMLSFLEYFPAKAIRFEGLITDAANEAEDILEYFMWNQIHKRMRLDVAFGHQLEKATGEISSIAAELMDLKRSLTTEDGRPFTDSVAAVSSSTNASAGDNDIVMGLDDDLTEIKARLCGESSKLEVIPIVGMGGIGKTTLARYAYDDALIIEHFDVRAWVTLSQDFSVGETLSSLVDSMKLGFSVDETLSSLVDSMKLLEEKKKIMAEKVYKFLKGRRYLIVMDDIWSTEAWDALRFIFPNDNNGSRIMLTTRLSNVAAYPISEGSSIHDMKFMDENQSWNLLQKRVFTDDQDCPPGLESIGKAIARGCRGLPLAVVLVAGILSTIAKTQASWEKIAKNVISAVDGGLEKILSLSYTHLPHHLRACFLYIGGFPEDYQISASKLIKLWIAEGFLKSERGCKSLEEEAEECLENLVRRSLVLINRRKVTGEIKRCSLHDVVREMCVRKAQDEKLLFAANKISNKNKRRINYGYGYGYGGYSWVPHSTNVHTCLCLCLRSYSELLDIVGRFRLLRVLDVRYSFPEGYLPCQLFELIHLRFFALDCPEGIPAAISNLHNLQSLIINSKLHVVFHMYLPVEIWRMQQLRHLVVPIGYKLPNPVDGSTLPLVNLQTLSEVINLECSKNTLKMIPNLKKLKLAYLEDQEDIPVKNLTDLHQLETLKISKRGLSLERLTSAFPRTLKKLSLVSSCSFPWKDMSVIGLLPLLQVLKLRHFGSSDDSTDTWVTSDGEFPQWRYLLIDASPLKHWITESSHFPRLKCLVFRYCYSLSAIPDDIGEIPTLELIEVDDVNQSLVESAKQIIADQQDYGNYILQFRHVR